MKKIGFIGAYDKIDLILYVAKIMTELGKSVLVVDATFNQKARYVVPVINPTQKYITEYENFDIAVGFNNFREIFQYLGVSSEEKVEYEYVLVDTDLDKEVQGFDLSDARKNYFVTSFDAYSLKKGLEAFLELNDTMELTKIIFSEQILKEEDDYLNFLSSGYKVIWDENRWYFPIENGDLTVIHENQRVAKIKFKKLSAQYKDGLAYITEEILKDVSESTIRKTIKMIERGT